MKIVYLDSFTANPGDISWENLNALGDFTAYARTSKNEVLTRCEGANAILTNKVVISKEIIDQLPELQYIGVTATGTNVVDINYAKEKGIQVTNVPGYSTDSVAQHVFAFILHFSSLINSHSDAVFDGKWVKAPDFSFTVGQLTELNGKTLGIIGLGSIGRKVAEIANVFGMKICAAHQSSMNRLQLPYNVEWLKSDEVFAKADFLTLHCPLTEQTENLVNSDSLAKMKKTAYVINTGRGPLIDEQALANALANGIIAGTGLDVLSSEPPSTDNPLLTAPNCVITPHVAWASLEARNRLISVVTENLESFINGKTLNLV